MAVKAYSGNYNWEEARIKCSEDGTDVKGELAAPRSPVENQWFVDKANELGLVKFWLGVNDRDVEGEYKNQHGSLHNYFRWKTNEPTGVTVANCVQTGGGYGYQWDDDVCSKRKNLLCTHVVGKAVISIKIQG